MKLYYSPGTSSLADHIALIESGLSFEIVKVDRKTKRTADSRDYLTINPTGYVPALEIEDGRVLTENVAVLSYIASRSGKLIPSEEFRRSRVLEILAFVASEIHKNFKPLFTPDASAEAKALATDVLRSRFALLNDRLGDSEFITGNDFTVADCYILVTLFWAKKLVRLDLPEGLSAYLDRIEQRPSVRQAFTAESIG